MEPMEINGGRFYVRPLHDDDRIDDRPALSVVFDQPVEQLADTVATARADWAANTRLTWAVCEQTSVELLALAELVLPAGFVAPEERDSDYVPPSEPACLCVSPAGDTERVLPNDPVLTPKTVGDAAKEGRETVRRWAEGFLEVPVEDDICKK
ncbi:hypothetical protein [Corynebacterium aquilae]|uniref:Uncharacterized protein n=1 Tax=Corynebacterium aquilae DSM 44791 TaxID=1431546 RepID=A0A1L7CE97_9CORY|nr:hypothetical protein [Corynebacterium aquilae]APT84148.1 hypothetical protein CAQU_02645 [Corynebacterium aquilae DSM 44791]